MKPNNGFSRFKKADKMGFYNLTQLKKSTFGLFDHCQDFNEDLAVVQKAEQVFLLDKSKALTQLKCEYAEYAGMGRWLCLENGLYGFVDRSGNNVVENKYQMLYHYQEGFAAFQINNKWGFIDLDGNEIKKAFSPLIWNFKNGYARAVADQGVVFLDKTMNRAFPGYFFEVRDFYEGLARVEIYR